jgi:hypothetical protein
LPENHAEGLRLPARPAWAKSLGASDGRFGAAQTMVAPEDPCFSISSRRRSSPFAATPTDAALIPTN